MSCLSIPNYDDIVCAKFGSLNEALLKIQNYSANRVLSVQIPPFKPKEEMQGYAMLLRLIGEFETLNRFTLVLR